jgi:hypothetical protein
MLDGTSLAKTPPVASILPPRMALGQDGEEASTALSPEADLGVKLNVDCEWRLSHVVDKARGRWTA